LSTYAAEGGAEQPAQEGHHGLRDAEGGGEDERVEQELAADLQAASEGDREGIRGDAQGEDQKGGGGGQGHGVGTSRVGPADGVLRHGRMPKVSFTRALPLLRSWSRAAGRVPEHQNVDIASALHHGADGPAVHARWELLPFWDQPTGDGRPDEAPVGGSAARRPR
jgi:hypothetical protein